MTGRSTAFIILQRLRDFPMVQLWNVALEAGQDPHTFDQVSYSSCFLCPATDPSPGAVDRMKEVFHHSGYAWAATPSFLASTGGLLDTCIVGGADRCMLLGAQGSLHPHVTDETFHPQYRRAIREWSARASLITQGRISYCPIPIIHGYHGPKADRQYRSRYTILRRHLVDPTTDIVKNTDGVWEWSNAASPALQDEVRAYFLRRAH